VSHSTNGRLLGHPLDRIFALYMAAAALALAFPHRPATWPLLLAIHLAVIIVAWPLLDIERWLPALSPRWHARIRALVDWAPLGVMPLLYTELATLNKAVHGGRYFDDIIIGWEQALFGGQPSQEWAASAPALWVSEPLHAAYLSYYLIIFVPPILLFLRGDRDRFRAGVFALMLTFFVHYLFFIYFPVQGPRYLYPAPTGELENGVIYQLVHRVLEAGSSQGSAFPSSHVGVSVAQTLVVWRFLPRLAPIITLLTIGLALGAIYGGFHYATDAVFGALLGVLAFMIAEPLRTRLRTARAA
jgi:membrane-associated phospholipid phosphatase